ncbi:MAG: HAD family hydrolase [Pseudonocardiaceae bacterium]
MTPTAANDPETLRHILTRTTALLLDFDGPVCNVFAGLSAQTVVAQLCMVLTDCGYGDPPVEIEKSDDPFQVLAYAASLGDAEARYVNAAFTAHEIEAIATAEPTPAAHDLIRAWSATGRPLAIVSNNSTIAIHAYLDLHNLRPHVTHVSARTSPDPVLLKPNPHLVIKTLTAFDVPAAAATFIGDSVTDIEAARAAHTMSIGYANKPGKITELMTAGADTVIHTPATPLRAHRVIFDDSRLLSQ